MSCNNRIKSDAIFYNGTVYTVDSAFTTVSAIVVKDGKILATGSTEQMLAEYNAAQKIDLRGQAVFPGFIDAHSHFVGYGRSLYQVNLYDCQTWGEVVEKVKVFASANPGEQWIRGRGWDQNKFPEKKFPTNKELSELFPDRPVLLQRVDGHAAIANAKALELGGVTVTSTINGGKIEVAGGLLTGLLIDNAVDLVGNVIPKAGKADYGKWLKKAQENCFAQGLTTVSDCGLAYYDVKVVDSLQREGILDMRLYVMLSDDGSTYVDYMKERDRVLASGDSELKQCYIGKGPYKTRSMFVKGVKAYADGALGSRGACLKKEYSDQHGWVGFLLSTPQHFDSLAAMLINTDLQLCTHAIGDSGNHVVLGIYGKYLMGKNDKRWRIEHAQVLDGVDFGAFGMHSIVPSVQPTHATIDMHWAGERLGAERLKGAYAYKQLLNENGWLPLGTDFPVEDISPIKTFYAAVARKDIKGFPEGGFQKENALTREQALRGITIWAAKACFLENEIGSLEVGKNADFVILDKDLMKADEGELLQVKVTKSYLNGKNMK
ncbi:MAG: amidohydrolase [Chitinophagaceae bacterium]|nr:amidohydrolase [Chitinophagaceae bacterium]